MPLNNQEIVSVMQQIGELKGLRATVTEVAKGACLAGGCAGIGGLVGGPVGLGIGGSIGSILGMIVGRGKYKSVPQVIMIEMSQAQRNRLAQSAKRIFSDLNAQDATMAVALLMSNEKKFNMLLCLLSEFLKNEMNMVLV